MNTENESPQLTYAASDILLMPSQYEPCGIAQMKSMHYGTIPVVRKTGGLADTVHEFNPETGEGTGFLFEEYRADAMLLALKKALLLYKQKDHWRRLIQNSMTQDFSWDAPVEEYKKIYTKLIT